MGKIHAPYEVGQRKKARHSRDRKKKGIGTGVIVSIVAILALMGAAPAIAAEDTAPSATEVTSTEGSGAPSTTDEQSTEDPSAVAAAEESTPGPAEEVADTSSSADSEEVQASQPDAKKETAPNQSASITTQTQENNDPKPGTLQPVWCHETGNGWKAQLGAKPSGGRHEAEPLIGDFGWGTTNETVPNQTLEHDRSEKLDAACAAQYEPKNDVIASVSKLPATCEVGETLVYGPAQYATYSGTPDGTVGPADYSVTATSTDPFLHRFPDGEPSNTYEGTLAGPKAPQSTDPYGDCYVPPGETETVYPSGTFTTASCEGSANTAKLAPTKGNSYVFEDKNGATFETEAGTGYDGGVPEGLAYGPITVSSHDVNPEDDTIVAPWDEVWQTVDPESLDCGGETVVASADVKITADATCTAPAQTEFVLVNATQVGETVPGSEPNHFVATFASDEGAFFADGNTVLVKDYYVPPAKDANSPECVTTPPGNPGQPGNPGTPMTPTGGLAATGFDGNQALGGGLLGATLVAAALVAFVLDRRLRKIEA